MLQNGTYGYAGLCLQLPTTMFAGVLASKVSAGAGYQNITTLSNVLAHHVFAACMLHCPMVVRVLRVENYTNSDTGL